MRPGTDSIGGADKNILGSGLIFLFSEAVKLLSDPVRHMLRQVVNEGKKLVGRHDDNNAKDNQHGERACYADYSGLCGSGNEQLKTRPDKSAQHIHQENGGKKACHHQRRTNDDAQQKDVAAPAMLTSCAVAFGQRFGSVVATPQGPDEESVSAMMDAAVLAYGGLDIFVNNAGIVRAGSLEEMTKANFELVTSVNYTAYFLCAKYASIPMKIQHAYAPARMSDIIEINSKSGLAGSNKNFAYAGSKFGGIGLTQSFALELAPFGIKVNAVCPGNYLDGPLWTDPERGLFVQYLKAGKVPGAKTVEDVKKYYESKVPLGRGCLPEDIARTLFYIVEQQYETGQALPVTGGQEMLK